MDQILTVIMPLFLLIGLGYLARSTVIDSRMLPALNQFVYYFAFPALLFNAARGQSFSDLMNVTALIAFLLAAAATTAVTVILSRYFFQCHDGRELTMRGLNSVFANFAYLGIPLTFGLLGEASYAATISIVLAGNLIIIGGAQLMIEIQRQHSISYKQVLTVLDRSLLRNPITISTLLGLVFSANSIPVPLFIANTLELLAPATIPVALFCLGASLVFKNTQTRFTEVVFIIAIKLFLHPALTLLSFMLLGVDDRHWLLATVLLTALPTGAIVHVLAMRYGAFEQASSQTVVFSTLASLGSVSLWAACLL